MRKFERRQLSLDAIQRELKAGNTVLLGGSQSHLRISRVGDAHVHVISEQAKGSTWLTRESFETLYSKQPTVTVIVDKSSLVEVEREVPEVKNG